MELVAPLPAEWAAIADPAARGSAPLRGQRADTPAAVVPFELCLELLASSLPDGEGLPATGKELPLGLLDAEAEAEAELAAELETADPIALPPLLLDSGLQAGLRVAAPPAAAASPLSASPAPNSTPAAAPALPPPSAALAPLPGDSVAALPTAASPPEELAAGEAPLSQPDEVATGGGTAARAPGAAAWLTALAAGDGSRLPPPTAGAAEPRAAVAPAAAAATAAPPFAADRLAARAPAPVQVLRAMIGDDAPPISPPAIAAAEPTVPAGAQWLPAPATGTTGTPSAPSVAVPSAPVDVRAQGWQEAFASRVQWLVDHKVGEARLKLNPPELGAVDVKISLLDDKTYVQLTTATAAARDELSQNLPRLRELFNASGLELGGASVHGGHDGHHPGSGYGSAPAESRELAVLAAGGGDESPWASRRSLGRIDVFA